MIKSRGKKDLIFSILTVLWVLWTPVFADTRSSQTSSVLVSLVMAAKL